MDSGDRSFPDRGLFQSAARHLFRKRRDRRERPMFQTRCGLGQTAVRCSSRFTASIRVQFLDELAIHHCAAELWD